MLKIGIVIGSTRPGRNGEAVAKWTYDMASKRTDVKFELIDLLDFNLPLLDEPTPAVYQNYTKEHTKVWSKKIAEMDGFIFVTPEYNHGVGGALKNAIDYLNVEWNNKAVGFVSYGSALGVRAVENLRVIVAELQMADVQKGVQLSLFTDFVDFSEFKPHPMHIDTLNVMLDQLIAWTTVLKPLRK
ncbi:MAG: NAD(P)H-dependent oxidoreductase [Erysipelotrichaceae bacterium]|nr:NAD(P)H-dependent oxidoreductase [Erysipelotrichaceae bacterium]